MFREVCQLLPSGFPHSGSFQAIANRFINLEWASNAMKASKNLLSLFFHFCILHPFLLINHLHLWRGKDNLSRTASCVHHSISAVRTHQWAAELWKVLVPRVGLDFKVLRKTLVLKVVTTGFHWMSSLAAKKKLQSDVIRWLKYFAVYNPQLCLRVNVKPPHSIPFPYLSLELHSHNSWRSVPRIVFGRHKHGAGARTHQRIGWSLSGELPSIFSFLFSKWFGRHLSWKLTLFGSEKSPT